MRDSFDREISYLRISVTDRCNLRCGYCMPDEGVPLTTHDRILSFEQIVAVVRAGVEMGIDKVRLTGGEPLVRRGVVDLVRMVAAVPGITVVAMTTNAVLLPTYAPQLFAAGLTHLNISLDTLTSERYRRITRGGDVQRAIAGVQAAVAAGFRRIKINMVILPDTDPAEVAAMKEFCRIHHASLQRIRAFDLTAHKVDGIEAERPLPCMECNRVRLLADGTLKPCLHSNIEVPLNAADPAASLRETIRRKPQFGSVCTNRHMVQIGG